MGSGPLRLTAFHDESATQGWFTTGILWVPSEQVPLVSMSLRAHRAAVGFWRESHFVELPGSRERRALARRWFDGFRRLTLGPAYFSAIVLDRRGDRYEGQRFPQPHFEYNRFTAMTLWSGYRKFWRDSPDTLVGLVSDDRPRKPPGEGVLGAFEGDNFAEYVPRRFEEDARKRYPGPRPRIEDLRLVPSHTPRDVGEDRPVEDLLQLCDLLTGATAQAFSRSSSDSVKAAYGTELKIMANATLTPPWKPRPAYCSRLAISQFPDEEGRMRSVLCR